MRKHIYGVAALLALVATLGVGAAPPEKKDEFPGERFGRLIDELLKANRTDEQVTEALFLATLGRLPQANEQKTILQHLAQQKTPQDRRRGIEDVLWALVNSREFGVHVEELGKRLPRPGPVPK
jgi:hypothetical protein